jgi:hypothetical protein
MSESITRELPLEQATCACGCCGPQQGTHPVADERESATTCDCGCAGSGCTCGCACCGDIQGRVSLRT